ncbi:MAG TPA: cyclase family protein [Gemmatimonadaceae bacterium]|nr:cyclase family protein [Gemmatimonadaceae bacterium]
MTRFYDVSMPVRSGGFVYPGNPAIAIEARQSIARGAGANVSSILFGSHTATHVDAARHFLDDGQTVDEIPVDTLIGTTLLISFDDDVRAIGADDLKRHDLGNHRRLLMRTRNSALLRLPDFSPDYTFLAPDGAEYLVERGVILVGVDYLSIEQFRSGHHRTHRTLLEKNVVIIEGLDLSEPPPGEYELFCLPLKLAGLDGAPARAVLRG